MALEQDLAEETQNLLTNDFYLFDRAAIHHITTPAYRQFLRNAGYGNLDMCSELAIAKKMLRYNQDVKNTGLNGTDGKYVVNINSLSQALKAFTQQTPQWIYEKKTFKKQKKN